MRSWLVRVVNLFRSDRHERDLATRAATVVVLTLTTSLADKFRRVERCERIQWRRCATNEISTRGA